MITIRFVLLGFCLWLAASLASGRGATNPIARVLRASGCGLMIAGALGLFIGLWSPVGLVLSIPLAAVLLFAIVNYGQRRYEAMQDTLLGLITLATRRGIPLAPLADAFARDAPSWAVWPATSFADKMRQGYNLVDAARGTIGLLPREATMAIGVGRQLDELAPCLDIYTQTNREVRETGHQMSNIMGYMMIVLVSTVAAGSFQLFFAWEVIPRYRMVFSDFGLRAPPITRAFGDTLSYAYLYYIPLLTFAFVLAVMVAIGWMIHLGSSLGWIPASLLGPLRFGTDTALVMRLLGMTIERERSIETTLMALGESHPQWYLRGRLRRAALDIRLGLDPWQTLAKRRLLRSCDVPLLESAARAGNLPWALDELARRNIRRAHRLTALVLRSLTAVCFVLVAAQVLFYAVAGFTPLATMIEAMS